MARKVKVWAMMKKGIPLILVRSVMSLYEGSKKSIRLDSELSEWILSCQSGFCVVRVDSQLSEWILSCQIGF